LGILSAARRKSFTRVREEMRKRIGDVVFRRTDFGNRRPSGGGSLQECAQHDGVVIGWDGNRVGRDRRPEE